MFNDLNSQQNGHQQIDDIFAETDKPNTNPNAGIETHRVGLTTNAAADSSAPLTFSEEPKTAKPMWLKVVPIIIIVSILILSGYLVYSKYFAQNSSPAPVVENPIKSATTTVENTNTNTNGTIIPLSTASTSAENNSANPTYVSELPGLSSTTPSGAITPTAPASTIDSDSDGLTDEEEKVYGTNPMALDTDADGLSDYEEVKIYHTNPLLSDTDGDSYLDGAEVKNGYNPNGAGKMPGVASSTVIK